MCRIIKKGIFPQIGRGKNLTPIVYVDDVVQAAIMAADRGIPGEAYLITSENSYELRVIARIFNFTPIVTPQSIKSAITDRVFSIDKAIGTSKRVYCLRSN